MVTSERIRRDDATSADKQRFRGSDPAGAQGSGHDPGSTRSQSRVSRPWLSQLETGKRTAELGRALWVLDALGLAVSLVPDKPLAKNGFDLDDYVDNWNA